MLSAELQAYKPILRNKKNALVGCIFCLCLSCMGQQMIGIVTPDIYTENTGTTVVYEKGVVG